MDIKLAFFDVDGTLSMPNYVKDGKTGIGFPKDEWGEYCAEMGEDTYKYCKPVMPVKRYAYRLFREGVILYVLTTSQSAPEVLAKEKFIENNYAGLFTQVISVGSDKEKLTAIREMAENHGVALSQCELVEDTFSTLLHVLEAGVKPTHISALVWDL